MITKQWNKLINKLEPYFQSLMERIEPFMKIIAIIFVIGVILRIANGFYNNIRLEKEGHLTKGTIVRYTRDAKGHLQVVYAFIVDKNSFTGEDYYDDLIKPKIGDEFTVVYLEDDPTVHRIRLRSD